jgi:hypothetical protein
MDYRKANAEFEARKAERKNSGYRPTKCKNCGYDIKGLTGSDRKAHTDGWCTNL